MTAHVMRQEAMRVRAPDLLELDPLEDLGDLGDLFAPGFTINIDSYSVAARRRSSGGELTRVLEHLKRKYVDHAECEDVAMAATPLCPDVTRTTLRRTDAMDVGITLTGDRTAPYRIHDHSRIVQPQHMHVQRQQHAQDVLSQYAPVAPVATSSTPMAMPMAAPVATPYMAHPFQTAVIAPALVSPPAPVRQSGSIAWPEQTTPTSLRPLGRTRSADTLSVKPVPSRARANSSESTTPTPSPTSSPRQRSHKRCKSETMVAGSPKQAPRRRAQTLDPEAATAKVQTKQDKAEIKKERNRQSAKASRDRVKLVEKTLTDQIEALTMESHRLANEKNLMKLKIQALQSEAMA